MPLYADVDVEGAILRRPHVDMVRSSRQVEMLEVAIKIVDDSDVGAVHEDLRRGGGLPNRRM
jgi:hypothetical protein